MFLKKDSQFGCTGFLGNIKQVHVEFKSLAFFIQNLVCNELSLTFYKRQETAKK